MVGDDVQGGPLIQMYARGDTSNVTIPSVFTSRTTAHLLSSLIGPGSFIEDVVDENGKGSLKLQFKPKKGVKKQGSRPTFTPTTGLPKATGIPHFSFKLQKETRIYYEWLVEWAVNFSNCLRPQVSLAS